MKRQLALCLLSFFRIVVVFSQVPTYFPATGLAGYWSFSGNANDESGNNNNGSVLSGVSLTTDRNGNSNSAYSINGIDGMNKGITIPLTIDNQSAYSIGIWFQIADTSKTYQTSSQQLFSSNPHATLAVGYGHPYYTGKLGSCVGDGSSWLNCSSNGINWELPKKLNWHYLTVIKSLNEINYYIDGNLGKSYSINSSYNVGSFTLILGAINVSSGEVFNGKLDDLSVWTRALNIHEIKTLFNGFVYGWTGTGNFSNASNWSSGSVPTSSDSAVIRSGILTINSSRTLDVLTIIGGATVKLAAPLTVRNLHIKNGTLDLNGQRLTVTGRIVQSTDSTNYYIQAGTSASPKPRSELAIKPSTSKNFTILINPNANRLYKLEIGNGSAAAQITLGNSIKIKGGEDGGNGPGLVTVNNNAKIIIPSGSTLTLESDTFNAGLNLAQPAQRSIVCTGTGKFNIERDHYGVRGWRLYSHPFKTDIDLQEVANDIELIGPGGTAEGFYSNIYTNSAAYWYDYSKADSGATTDPAWTEFTSAKGSTISGNTNKWKKNSPLLLFNPGNRFGTGAYGYIAYRLTKSQKDSIHGKFFSPFQVFNCVQDKYGVWFNFLSDQDKLAIKGGPWNWILSLPEDYYNISDSISGTPIYEQGKLTWNYTLDSTAVHLNDGTTQSISTGVLPSTSKYFFITNPFTMPVRLSKIEGLNSSNVDPYFYYWKQRRNTVTDNFSPAEWQAEKIVTGTAARDSNISIPAFGTILVRLKNSSTTFTIPESAKQLTNFSYIIGGAKGISKTGLMFTDVTGSNLGSNSVEIKLLVNDSLEADRVLVYDEQNQSNQYTTSDARKFVNPDFPNLFAYSQDGKPLALDMQDIAEQLNSGKSEVEIPLGIEREIDKRYATLNLQMSENNTEYLIALKDKTTGNEMQLQTLKTYPVEFKSEEISIGRYSLVFRRATNSLKDFVTTKNTTASGSQSTQTGIFLYPNPASNQLYISTNQGDFRGTVEVCDLLGRVILTQTYSKEKPLNISKLQAGSYFVKTSQGTQLFIKE